MMYTSAQIIETAKLISPALPKLLSSSDASKVQDELQSLIAVQDFSQIWKILSQYPQTHRWCSRYLRNNSTRSGSRLLGNKVADPSSLIYACAHCDYRDVIFFLGMTPERCPKHPKDALFRV